MIRRTRVILLTAVAMVSGLLPGTARADESGESLFRERVEPILRKQCYGCHSHTAGEMEGGLTLDWRSGWEKGGVRGAAIVPGKPQQSLLIRAVRRVDSELKMPPEESLSDDEIAVLTRWVQGGAFDDRTSRPLDTARGNPTDWWSLKPLARPPVPGHGYGSPIDAFIRDRLQREGITPSPPADRRTLIRRVMYDLVGLPPTPAEVEAFVSDPDPLAYDKLVDRLLNSPRYGERWARHWLDTIHFADSHGFEHDVGRDNAWRFRDYVIDVLNRDTPWPRFIREQLAADVLFAEDSNLTAALGFLGAGPFDFSAFSTAPVTFEYIDRDDLVTQTMASFVSTTANCARCHAHKFDPISQEDYYSLQAVFAGVTKGDVAYDSDPAVARERRRLQSLIAAAEQRDVSVLLAPEHQPMVSAWSGRIEKAARWVTLDVDAFLSAEGSQLSRIEDGSYLASGQRPETDTYTIVGTTSLANMTAVRLEVLAHQSLPKSGPGRQDNGNLHLSEFELQLFEAGAAKPKPVEFGAVTADFNQVDWGIDKALDGNIATAWGIFPAVGQSHQAVFELAKPIALKPGARLAFVMKQMHGAGHLIGAFRLSVTADDPAHAIAIPSEVATALALPAETRAEAQKIAIAALALRRSSEAAIKALPAQVVAYAAGRSVNIPTGKGQSQARSLAQPQTVHVLQRGDFNKPLQVAQPGALSVLEHLPPRFELKTPGDEGERRAALAEWLAHRDNVLTWRSVVNRVWHHHFGRGLCDTPSDFGRMGGVPSHPELLDWLAIWFRDDAAASLKTLQRMIVTSATYRQSSQHRDAPARLDTDNRLLWRQQRRRLDADSFRDFTLAVSGSLDLTMGGPGVQHFTQSPGPQLTPALDYTAYDWNGPGAGRRSIYRFVWRGIPDPFMETLDFPDLGLLTPTRGFSTSSLQALAVYNNDFVLHHSAALSQRVERDETDIESQVTRVVKRVWCREPTPGEHREFVRFARAWGLASLCRVLLNSNEFLFVN